MPDIHDAQLDAMRRAAQDAQLDAMRRAAQDAQLDAQLDELVQRAQDAKGLLVQVKDVADRATADLKDALQARASASQVETYSHRTPSGVSASLTHTVTWRLDSKRLKSEAPATYAAYARQSQSWTMRLSA